MPRKPKAEAERPAAVTMATTVELIKTSDLAPSPTNPRKTFDQAALQELADSIKTVGLLQPIVVRKLTPFDPEIVAGERRWRAARLAGLELVPCSVRELTDDEVCEIQLVENCQRADVHPMEEARALKAMQDRKVYADLGSLASKIGRPVSYVARRLVLANLIPDIEKMLDTGAVSLAVAERVGRMPAKDQKAILSQSWYLRSVDDVRRWAETKIIELSKARFDLTSETLCVEAGPCTKCPKNSANALIPDDQPFCEDRSCFLAKSLANARLLKEARPELVELSLNYNQVKNGLSRDKWNGWDTKNAVGVVVEGDLAEIGQVHAIHLVADSKGKPADPEALKAEEAAKRKQRTEDIRAHRAENSYRYRLWQECRSTIVGLVETDSDPFPILDLFTFLLLSRGKTDVEYSAKYKGPGHEAHEEYLGGIKSESDLPKQWEHFKKLSVESAAVAMVDAVARLEVQFGDYHKPSCVGLEALAEILEIDTAPIRAAAEAEFAPKTKKEKKAS